MTIPVENIYYLLCYAWGHLQERERTSVGAQQCRSMADLLGHVLARVTASLVAQGLDRGYLETEAAVAGVKGKLDVNATVNRMLAPTSRTWCRFDDFTHDILANQVLKATVTALSKVPQLDSEVRGRLLAVLPHFLAVSDRRISSADFGRVLVHRNNRGYGFAMKLAELVFNSLIVDESTGSAQFHDFREDEARMGQLFEEFLFNFFRAEQGTDAVTRPHIQWRDAAASNQDMQLLPVMKTDIVLTNARRVLVIDAKYYKETLQRHYNVAKVHSSNLYQIFTYLENLAPGLDCPAEGMLLYPTTAEDLDIRFNLKGNVIRVATINLGQCWQHIHSDLLRLVQET
jgi:5-methylcytosine-specific restriction enzyme subunit McrC